MNLVFSVLFSLANVFSLSGAIGRIPPLLQLSARLPLAAESQGFQGQVLQGLQGPVRSDCQVETGAHRGMPICSHHPGLKDKERFQTSWSLGSLLPRVFERWKFTAPLWLCRPVDSAQEA